MTLYTYNINDLTKTEYEKWYNLLSDERKEKVDRYVIESRKKSTVVGEMLVKKGIEETVGIDPSLIEIATDEKGKPYAKNINIHFNISHSHDLVVCVISDENIGIDIEKIRPVNLSLAKTVCTENELTYLFGKKPTDEDYTLCENEKILKRFFNIWTTKEAYFKCTGTGITNLKSVDCTTLNFPVKTETIENYIIKIVTI